MVLVKVVANEWLSTIFVDSLKNFVSCSVSKAWEEGKELGADRSCCLVLEDDLCQFAFGLRARLSV